MSIDKKTIFQCISCGKILPYTPRDFINIDMEEMCICGRCMKNRTRYGGCIKRFQAIKIDERPAL
jgi:hypothetical protein